MAKCSSLEDRSCAPKLSERGSKRATGVYHTPCEAEAVEAQARIGGGAKWFW